MKSVNKKIEGEAMKPQWATVDRGTFVEVVPIENKREHWSGDECWCQPEIERNKNSRPLVSHNFLPCPACLRGVKAFQTKLNEVALLCNKHKNELNGNLKTLLESEDGNE